VAWISERKDVFECGVFHADLGAYIRYGPRLSLAAYLLVLFMVALGLMSKPMLVTLPFVLLLLITGPSAESELRICKGGGGNRGSEVSGRSSAAS